MKLFWATWALLAVATIHLLGDLHYIYGDIKTFMDVQSAVIDQGGKAQTLWGASLVRLGLSGYYFSAPVVVELLHRIWRRLEAGALPAPAAGN